MNTDTPTTKDLCIGQVNPRKMVHHRRCSSARSEYTFARTFDTLDEFAAALVASGAWRWHGFCQRCCGDLDDAVRRALAASGVSS
jgi:hypothetical protein